MTLVGVLFICKAYLYPAGILARAFPVSSWHRSTNLRGHTNRLYAKNFAIYSYAGAQPENPVQMIINFLLCVHRVDKLFVYISASRWAGYFA